MAATRAAYATCAVTAALVSAACGSRTGLGGANALDEGEGGLVASEGGVIANDGGVGDGGVIRRDAGVDAQALCNDGGPLEVTYMLDDIGGLYRYDVATRHATRLGVPNCGNANVQWTVTASRENAYIVYTDWSIYAVDLTTLACTRTPFQPGALGIDGDFGVAVLESGGVERLYVYGEQSGASPIIAVSDLTSFALTKVGDVSPAPPVSSFPVNLTSDTLGHLYAFSPGGLLQQIDAATGAVVQSVQTGIMTMSTWASFTNGPDVFVVVGSHVDGYDLATRKQTSSIDIGISPVGACSVSLCP